MFRQVCGMPQAGKILHYTIINVILSLIGMLAYGQNGNNYLDVASSIKNFNLNSVSALETEQVQSNAFSITVKSKSASFSVYAIISFYNSSNGFILPGGMLNLKLNNVSPSRSANYNEIPISGGNQLIIQSSKTNNNKVTYTFNLHFGPAGYEVPPGTYNATILFTMTQP